MQEHAKSLPEPTIAQKAAAALDAVIDTLPSKNLLLQAASIECDMHRDNPIRLRIWIEQNDPKLEGKLEQLSADCLSLGVAAINSDVIVEHGAAEFGNWGDQADKAFLLEIPLNQATLDKLTPQLRAPLSIPPVTDHFFSRSDSSISQKFADQKHGLKDWASKAFNDSCGALAALVGPTGVTRVELNEKLRARFQTDGAVNAELADKPFPSDLMAEKFRHACSKLDFLVSSGLLSKSELENNLNERFGLSGAVKSK